MNQPPRGINENLSSIRRASLKILSALHRRWREDIRCPLFPLPFLGNFFLSKRRSPIVHRAAAAASLSSMAPQMSATTSGTGNPVPGTASGSSSSPFHLFDKVPSYPHIFILKAEMQGIASQLSASWSPSLKDHRVLSISSGECQNIIPLSMATAMIRMDWSSTLPRHRRSEENETRFAPAEGGHYCPAS